MSQNYNVDDILEEVRRKKAQESGQAPPRPSRPPRPAAQPVRPAARDAAPRRPAPQRKTSADAGDPGFHFDAPIHQQEEFEDVSLPEETDFSQPDTPLSPDEDHFSLHFNLDDTHEERLTPEEEPPEQAESGFTQEVEAPRARSRGSRRLAKSDWQRSYAEQEAFEQEVPEDDFASMEDAPFVKKDLKTIRAGLIIRAVVTFLLGLASSYLVYSLEILPQWLIEKAGLPEKAMLPLPNGVPILDQIVPENNMTVYLILNLLICAIAAIVCSNIVGPGIVSLFRLQADNDSPAALAVLAVLIQGIVLIFFPESVSDNAQVSLYFPVAIFALLFTLFGKLMLVNRMRRNFNFLVKDSSKYAFVPIRNRDFAREFSRGLGPDVDSVFYSARTDFVAGLLDKSYTDDYSASLMRFAAPIAFLSSIAVGVVTMILAHDPAVAVSASTAILCVCAPFSAAIVPNLMLSKMSKRLTAGGAMIAGYETAEDLAAQSAVVLSDKELFPGESVMLHGMKVFAEKRIDEAILDAASVILSCKGIMSSVFLNMVGGNKKLLKKVDGLIYEDGMGLSAWVDGKRVLIGNLDLMHNHEIDCPTRDFERRYTRDGRKVLYIANSGELSAMFVLSYNADPKIAAALEELEKEGDTFSLYSTDPNITGELLASTFGIRRGSVRVLPAKLHPEYMMLTRQKERMNIGAVHGGGVRGVLRLVRAAHSIQRSVTIGATVQLVGTIVGYGLIAFMAFFSSLNLAAFWMLLAFLAGWCLLTTIISAFG